MSSTIRTIDAPRCHLGEGPCYDPDTDTAWWVDILERRLFTAPLAGGAAEVCALPFMVSGVFAVDADRRLLAAEDGLYLRGRASGGLHKVCPLEAEDGATRSNDGRVHPSGALWISTMGRDAERGRGAIYHVAGTCVTRLYDGLTIPNAICFSPDGSVAYFADTDEGILRRVAVNPGDGLPTGMPSTLYDHRGGAGGLDGAAVDADGLVWNARWGAGCLDAYTPEGSRVRSIALPATRPSCPTFAGPRLDRIVVTSACEGMSPEEIGAGDGRTFVVPFGGRGLLEPCFRLGR